jgi:MarR family 2-MHQ and catechol resistance regulon transcriptional repressor
LPQKRRESTTVVNASRLQADARDLHEALSELVQAYQFRDRITVCYHDISVTQCYAMTLNSLAAELYLDKSTASRVVDALVQKGYVRRLPDPGDARALSLEATGKGLDLHARIIEELIEEMKNLIADSSPAKRRATIQLVGRLARAASKKFKRKARRCGREA